MKELKLRAWFPKTKKMLHFSLPHLNFEYGMFALCVQEEEYKGIANMPHDFDEVKHFMFYTGLKDRRGIEIYDGDIVNFNFVDYAKKDIEKKYDIKVSEINNNTSKVYWCRGGWWAIELWIGGSAPLQHTFGNHRISDTNIKIIGNQYENPNLIN